MYVSKNACTGRTRGSYGPVVLYFGFNVGPGLGLGTGSRQPKRLCGRLEAGSSKVMKGRKDGWAPSDRQSR